MALVVKDRVKETTTTTGTGTITLAGAASGFQSFSVIGNGNTTYYAIVGTTEWEVGLGTYTSSGTTLSRDTVLESSNGGSLVNFSAGTKDVFVTYPADKSVYSDATDNVVIAGSYTGTGDHSFGVSTGVNSTVAVGGGATASGFTKAVNIGADGASGSTTNIALGSATSGATTATTINGTVGIGGSPVAGQILAIQGGGAGANAMIRNTGTAANNNATLNIRTSGTGTTATTSSINFGDGDSLSVGGISYLHDTDTLRFTTSSSNVVFVTTTGMGLGFTPSALLDVNGDAIFRNNIYFEMLAPTSKSAAATLTGAEVVGGYIQYTGAAATLTLPTATNLQAAMPTGVAASNDMAFDFTIINTGSGTATLAVNTGITAVGALTTATNTATTFHVRKTATNTFIIYRT